MRLFCLPYAGGSAAVFRPWVRALERRCDVVAVELPGHGRRVREPLCASSSELVDRLIRELEEQLNAGPFALFGHSMGGLLAFQMAHELVRRRLRVPFRLFLSGVRAPGRGPGRALLHTLPEAELVEALGRLNGAPVPVLADAEVMKLLLPVVRADLRVAETWSFRPTGVLSIAVSLVGGSTDPLAPPEEMDRWRGYFAGPVDRRTYPGDHFYLLTDAGALLQHIADALARTSGQAPATTCTDSGR